MANDVFDIKQHFRVQYLPPAGTWTNIVTDTYEVSIDRGITVEQGVFARPDVGTAEIRLMKSSLADMLSGPAYKSNMPIRIQFQLLPDSAPSAWTTLFYGLIQNVSMAYEVTAKKLQVTITANDFMKVMLNSNLSAFNVTGTSASSRSFRTVMGLLNTAINAVDSRVSLTQGPSGGTLGSSTTQWAWTWQNTPAGEILTQFLDAELAWSWVARDGAYCLYLTRLDVDNLQSTTWNTANYTVSNVHSNAVTHFCMDNIEFQYNSDELVNQVIAHETYNNVYSTSTNSTSVTDYGKQSGNFDVKFDNTGISTLGDWASAVSAAANPRSVKSVSVPAIRRDGLVSQINTLDIAYPLQVEFASTGLTTMQEIHMITRLTHNITAEHWEVNVGLWRGI